MGKILIFLLLFVFLISFVNAPLSETLRPDGELSDSGLVASDYTDHDADPDEDSSVTAATGNNVNTEYGVDFPTPTGNPTEGADLQEFRAGVEEYDVGQGGTPEARIELWEDGILIRAGSDTPVSTYAVLSFTWNANELSTADGSLVQCKVIGTKSGGSPSNRNTVNIGQIEWNVIYTEDGGALTDNLTVGWQFDESSGLVAEDMIGANDGDLDPDMTDADWVAGKIGNALDFDGTNDHVDSNFQVVNIASNKTVNYWIKTTDQTSTYGVAAYDGNDYVYFGRLNSLAAEKIEFGIYDGTNQAWIETTNTGFEDGAWHMLTFVQSGNTASDLKIYLDGTDTEASVTIAGTINADALNQNSFIAALNNQGNDQSNLDGEMDMVYYWDRALTSGEITELWNSGDGLAYPFSEEEENCWTETPGKIIIPPGCQYYTSVKEGIAPA